MKCGNNISKTILEEKRWEFVLLFSIVQLQRAVVEQIMGHNWCLVSNQWKEFASNLLAERPLLSKSLGRKKSAYKLVKG